MKTILMFGQIILSLLVISLVFLQSGGDSESRQNILSTVRYEKRGWEKVTFNLTLVVLIIFLLSSIIQTLI